MDDFLKLLIQLYQYLLRLYPRSMQEGFAEEMLSDFSDLATDASRRGASSLVLFCVKELFDFPINLLRMHWRESRLLRLLRLQPMNYGLRSAIGYGLGFASITFLGWWVSRMLFAALDPLLQSYSIWYWESFQNERFIWLFNNFVTLLSYACTAMLFGLMFALLTGNSQKRRHYFWAGALAWFVPNLISNVLLSSFGWSYYLNVSQMNILGKFNLVLEGMFYSAALVIAESHLKGALRRLAIMAVLYPSLIYLSIKLAFYFWLEITGFFFPGLILLLSIVMGSLFVIMVRNDKKSSWLLLIGAATYPVLFYDVFRIIYSSPLTRIMSASIPTHKIVDLTLSHAMIQAFLGMCFGLLLGLIFGFQKKGNSSLLAT